MRKSGALSLALSAGLIAVLALMLRVLTAPVKLSPERVKVPMAAWYSPVCLRDRAHRGLDGDRQAGGDRRRTRLGRSAAKDGGWTAILLRDAKALAPAENSRLAAIASQAIEVSTGLRPDQAIKRRQWACPAGQGAWPIARATAPARR